MPSSFAPPTAAPSPRARFRTWPSGRLRGAAAGLILAALAGPAAAQISMIPTPTGPIPAGPLVVVDAGTGEVLMQRDAGTPWHPASLAKLMTVYIVFEEFKAGRLKPSDPLGFSDYARTRQPSKLGAAPGQTITLEQAVAALILRSANDVAVAVAERVSGAEPAFAERMTATARRLGMTGTTFRNASGWPDPAQVTTARDMAMLSLALLRDFPDRYPQFAQRDVPVLGQRLEHSVKFLELYPGADGLKTGYICASGFNIAASAVRDGRRLVAVALGFRRGDLRDEAASRAMDEAFAKKSGGAGQRVWQIPAAGGVAPTVLGEGECGRVRYDLPGVAVWLGTFGDERTAKALVVEANGRLAKFDGGRLGREYILWLDANKVRRYATMLADLDPGDARKLCDTWRANGRFCAVKRPDEFVAPFMEFWTAPAAQPGAAQPAPAKR